MAHEIETMFSVGETPWHGLGKVLEDAPTVEQAIKLAGLDWMVRKQPIHLADGTLLESAQATVRVENALDVDGNQIVKELGVVSPRYTVLQNAESFGWFDPMVSSGLVSLETAGALQAGKRIWIMARVVDKGSDIKIVGDDVVRKYILLSNSHDGSMSIRVGFTPVRVVCANTLAMAIQNGASQLIRLKHQKGAIVAMEQLREMMNLANRSFEATADQFRTLAAKNVANHSDLERYVKLCLDINPDLKEDELSTRTKNQVMRVLELFTEGRGHDLVGVRGTYWAAYNAVTQYLTHEAGNSADTRYNSLWFGTNRERNEKALETAMAMAA